MLVPNDMIFTASLTPAALAAALGVTEQAFVISTTAFPYANAAVPIWLKTTDWIAVTPPSALNTNCGIVGCRVSTTGSAGVPGTVTIAWGNFTAVANVPPAGTYLFRVSRL